MRVLLARSLAVGVPLYGAWRITDTPDQPAWLQQQRVTASGLGRFMRTGVLGLRVLVDYKSSMLLHTEGTPEYDEALEGCHRRAAQRIVDTALHCGGVYIKMGQGLASFNHLLPTQYVETLAQLQDQALPCSAADVERVLDQDIGGVASFADFDMEPIAAGSIAQVHRATLHNGDKVAVKVQYWDLRDRFHGDHMALKFLLAGVEIFFPDFNFGWILDELRDTLAAELDFENEAVNAANCMANVPAALRPSVHVPVVVPSLTSKRVLTTEFIEGVKVTDRAGLEKLGVSESFVMYTAVALFGHQLFSAGLVHADPHPGNMMVRRGPAGQPQLVLLDHGLYIHLSDAEREAFGSFVLSVVMRDEDTMAAAARCLNVDDPFLFADMVLQRPYKSHALGGGLMLTIEDLEYIKRMAVDRMDAIMGVLRVLPKSLLMAFRNLNIVRSVNMELGTPVHRFNVLATEAARASPQGLFQSMRFQLALAVSTWTTWFKATYIAVSVWLGLMPDVEELAVYAMAAS